MPGIALHNKYAFQVYMWFTRVTTWQTCEGH